MKQPILPRPVKRRDVFIFARLIINPLIKIIYLSVISPKKTHRLSDLFADIYSKLWDYAEHSISHQGFNLPSALGVGAVNRVNEILCKLYGSKYACLSFGGTSGAMLTLLTAVFPKLNTQRDLILFDDACHQSTIGGLIFGRWKAIRLPRDSHAASQSVCPVKFETVKSIIEEYGPENFAAIILVLPSYDGFRSPSEDRKIYKYAQALKIPVIIDGAWDALRFRGPAAQTPPLDMICDVWITSPHKRGLTPSSLGCILTNHLNIARLWDEASDLGFRSSSVSFVEIMIAEHRLSQVLAGQWDKYFDDAHKAAEMLRSRISEIHSHLEVIKPSTVRAEIHDPAHILISTHKLPALDARDWAKTLTTDFSIDVEKATASTLLLLCGDPQHLKQIDLIISNFQDALEITLKTKQKISNDT